MRNKSAYIWNFTGRIVPQILFLFCNMVLARYLTDTDFGAVGVLTVFISLATTLSDAGFSGSLVKEKIITNLDCSTVFVFNMIISIIIYIIIVLCSGIMATFFHYPSLQAIIILLSLVFVIRAFGIVPRTKLIKDLRFKYLSIISIFSVTLSCIVAICCAILKFGVYSLVAYQLLYAVSETILIIILSRYHFSVAFSMNSFKRLFSFGFFTTICNVIDSIYENIIGFLFGHFLSLSTAGYYSQAQKIESAATNSMAQTLNSVSFPILVKFANNRDTFISESYSIANIFISLIFPLIFIGIVFSDEIITLLYGHKWLASSIFLKLLLFVGIFQILESLERNNIKSLGYVKELSKITFYKRILGVIIIFIFLFLSPFSMLYGFIASTALGFIINKWLLCKILQLSFIKNLLNELKLLILPFIFFITIIIFKSLANNILLETTGVLSISIAYYFIMYQEHLKKAKKSLL